MIGQDHGKKTRPHSGMAAAIKHRALAFYFPVRIWYFPNIVCRGESDLDQCMTSVLAKRIPLHSADFWFLNVFGRKICWMSTLRSGILFASPEVMHRPRSDTPLYFDIWNMWQIRTEKLILVLGVCLTQPCPSAGRRFATSRSCFKHNWTIHSFAHKSIRWNATKYARDFQPNPTLLIM